MNENEKREPGEGTGQHRRTGGALLELDLNAEVRWLDSEQPWQAEHTAHTIVKYPDLRIVLIAIRAGGRIKEHRTAGRVSIQALSGEFEIRANDQPVQMTAGKLLALDQNVLHEVSAKTNSVLLLTIALPQ
jgi:quercetin dioxygenase-like cupin family protein